MQLNYTDHDAKLPLLLLVNIGQLPVALSPDRAAAGAAQDVGAESNRQRFIVGASVRGSGSLGGKENRSKSTHAHKAGPPSFDVDRSVDVTQIESDAAVGTSILPEQPQRAI